MPTDRKKGTMRREIRAYIQRQIAEGVYRPGERIVETQLARAMNVSQAPVREALLELSAMGLLEERPYSGTYVRRLTVDDIEDIYNTRAFLDEYAARQAARRIAPEQLDAMETLLRRMDQAEDDASFAEMDIAFHAMVVDDSRLPQPRPLTPQERLERAVYLRQEGAIRAVWSAGRKVFSPEA